MGLELPGGMNGAANLGAAQVRLTGVSLTPAVRIQVCTKLGGVTFDPPMLQIIDLSNGQALLTEIDAIGAAAVIREMQKITDVPILGAGVDSAAHDTTGGQADGTT